MSAKALRAALLAGTIVLSASPARAEAEAGVALRQNALTLTFPNRPEGSPLPAGAMGVTDTRMRAWLGQAWGDATFTGAVEVQTGFNSSGAAGLGLLGGTAPASSRPFEAWNLTWDQASPSTATSRARVERLDVSWRLGRVDLKIGRQPVSLGTSHFVGVLDVLSPISPGAMDGSYKTGVDALRARTDLGETGEAEVILAGSDPWNVGGALARVRSSVAGTDVELLGGRFRDRGFGGLGWEGELGPAGFWGELALFQRRPDAEPLRAGWSQAAFSGVTGLDFNLPFEARGGLAVMYQDFGARRPEDLASVYADAPYKEGWAFLGSAGYGVVTLSRQLHPLVQGGLSGLVNLVDGSTLWQPRVTFSISDNADLGAYGWIGTGAAPRLQEGRLAIASEFGMVPTGGGIYARWFF